MLGELFVERNRRTIDVFDFSYRSIHAINLTYKTLFNFSSEAAEIFRSPIRVSLFSQSSVTDYSVGPSLSSNTGAAKSVW